MAARTSNACLWQHRLLYLSCCWLIGLIAAPGCSTAARRQLAAIAEYDRGSPAATLKSLDEASSALRGEKQIIAVDRAIATLMSGDAPGSEAALRETRRELEFLRQKDIREQAVAVLSDDKAVKWAGREFEQRMIDNMLVLASLVGNQHDAFAYSTQVMEKLTDERQQLAGSSAGTPVLTVGHSEETPPIPRPPARLSPNALSAYLHAAVHSERSTSVDVMESAIDQVGYWKTSSQITPEDTQFALSEAAKFGTRSTKGHGVLHVITFAGRITDWEAERAVPTTAALLIADQILSAVGNHTLPPTIAPVLIARPKRQESLLPYRTAVQVNVPVQPLPLALSQTLVDLNAAAWNSYQADRDQQIARAVSRRIVKKGAVYAAKDQMAIAGGGGADLLMNLGGIIWEALEKPDTRHITLLPERIDVAQLELPAGLHPIELFTVTDGAGSLPTSQQRLQFNVHIDDARNTFVLCFRPNHGLAGTIVLGDGQPPVILQ